jgi:hypothetical protein
LTNVDLGTQENYSYQRTDVTSSFNRHLEHVYSRLTLPVVVPRAAAVATLALTLTMRSDSPVLRHYPLTIDMTEPLQALLTARVRLCNKLS